MHASAKLGLALIAAVFSGSINAEAVLKNQSTFRSTAGDEAQGSLNYNPKEFPVKKLNGPHTGAAPVNPPVAPLAPAPVPATPALVQQPRPTPLPARPSKIDAITIKQGTR